MYPQVNSLTEGDDDDQFKIINEKFLKKFEKVPEFYAKAPGRVNLIGEHIDYCGYAVFPMAIRQSIIIAVCKRDDGLLKITNCDSHFEDFKCDINTFQIYKIPAKWYKYVLSGIQGIKESHQEDTIFTGLSLLISGNIPPAAGLSSSSALVCASALVASHVLDTGFTSKKLAEICAMSERYIGTQGGGMDQAASFLSKAGSAQLIEFDPLRCSSVSLPKGANFVVVNSLASKHKATSSEFNTRVVECRLACMIIAKYCGIRLEGKATLGILQQRLDQSFSQMIELVKKILHPQPYSKKEICQLLDVTDIHLEQKILSENTRSIPEFNLYKRALHVFTEASRVLEFKKVCDDWNENQFKPGKDRKSEVHKVLQTLGKLMDESHCSTQHLYECSHSCLDEIVELSKGIAIGARLTGAGWGGCIVALVAPERTEEYVQMLKRDYFKKNNFKITQWDEVIFSSKPEQGATIYIQ